MNIEIEDLEIGDEVLVAANTNFKRLRILRAPSKNKEGNWKSIKCDIRNDSVGKNVSWSNYNYKDTNYNDTIYFDFRWRDIWLIKKAETC